MDDLITEAELKRLQKHGAKISHEKDEALEVKGLDSVIEAINRAIAANQSIMREQAANIEKVIKAFHVVVGDTKVNTSVDTKPIAEAIRELQSNHQPREAVPYTFNIERDQRGFMKSVEVTPKQPTIN